MTTLMNIKTQYPSLDDARLAHQACADPEAFASYIDGVDNALHLPHHIL
ncbi:MAG: hypothetical protein L0Z71_00385 [Anaerolineae bacterium]|nr:hypothetical protein [Anaerolineae bacterium]